MEQWYWSEWGDLTPRCDPVSLRFNCVHFLLVTGIRLSCHSVRISSTIRRCLSRQQERRCPLDTSPLPRSMLIYSCYACCSHLNRTLLNANPPPPTITITHFCLWYAENSIKMSSPSVMEMQTDFLRKLYTTKHLRPCKTLIFTLPTGLFVWKVQNRGLGRRLCLYINSMSVYTGNKTFVFLATTVASSLQLCTSKVLCVEFKIQDLRSSRQLLWRMSSSGLYKLSSYLTGDTLLLRYRVQPVNAM
jgi:hypothetical protein